MVYEWDNKRDECYFMYITEKKSLEEIIEFYKGQNFAPRYVVDSTALSTAATCATFALKLIFKPTPSTVLPTERFL